MKKARGWGVGSGGRLFKVGDYFNYFRLRACLHGGGVPHIGEVTRLSI